MQKNMHTRKQIPPCDLFARLTNRSHGGVYFLVGMFFCMVVVIYQLSVVGITSQLFNQELHLSTLIQTYFVGHIVVKRVEQLINGYHNASDCLLETQHRLLLFRMFELINPFRQQEKSYIGTYQYSSTDGYKIRFSNENTENRNYFKLKKKINRPIEVENLMKKPIVIQHIIILSDILL